MSLLDEIWAQAVEMKNEIKNEMKNIDTDVEKVCCNNVYLSENEGYISCTSCGSVKSTVVIDDSIFSFENGEGNRYLHSFGNALYPISSQATYISGTSKIAKLQSWVAMPYNERVIWEVSNVLKARLQENFSSRVINDALYLYKDFYAKSDIYRGDNKWGFVAVCVYIAASKHFMITTPSEIADYLGICNKAIFKCLTSYSEIMGNVIENKKAVDFLSTFCDRIDIPYKTRKPIKKIINVVEEYNILGGTLPKNICIAVIVFVCKEMKTPLDLHMITKEFDVSLTTLEKINGVLTVNKQEIFKKCK
jgi:transcription initiation factor TFIIIB Brf1 subunit/transcription initiation factor TFIIB